MSSVVIGIVNFGSGNLFSLYSCIRNLQTCDNLKIRFINNSNDFYNVDRIIIPGQGNHINIFNNYCNLDIMFSLFKEINTKPILGICLGSQMFSSYNMESCSNGFCLFKSFNNLFRKGILPCIGWCYINILKSCYFYNNTKILSSPCYYFSHSYYNKICKYTVCSCYNNGIHYSCCNVFNNIVLTQFHPEISGRDGIIFINKFINWNI